MKYYYKSIFGVELAYLKINHLIQSIVQPVGDVFVNRPENFGFNYSFNLISWLSADIVKNWHVNASLIVFHLINKGTADDQIVNNNINSGELEISNQFRLSKKWSAEISGLYATSHLQGQTKTEPFWHLEGGIQKMILKEKGTLKLSVNDIFHSIVRRDNTTAKNLVARRIVETDTRRIGIAFSYRFGKDTNNRKRNHNTGGAAEEQGRVN